MCCTLVTAANSSNLMIAERQASEGMQRSCDTSKQELAEMSTAHDRWYRLQSGHSIACMQDLTQGATQDCTYLTHREDTYLMNTFMNE